jgi:Deoxyribonuclease II
MKRKRSIQRFGTVSAIVCTCIAVLLLCLGYAVADAPRPLVKNGDGVDWWFVFKFNSTSFSDCGDNAKRVCIFGGKVQNYGHFSQQFVYATDKTPDLKKGSGCVGDSVNDPIGSTFDQVYSGDYVYVIWNDQFYLDPKLQGCGNSCGGPWGHSKGMLAWDDTGEGFVMQVTTPNWPGAGSRGSPRARNGNTLGCLTQIKDSKVIPQNNVLYSQHFFALRLSKDDLAVVLKALENASVVTDPKKPQVVKNGGPQDIQDLVNKLGKQSDSETLSKDRLSTGVTLISKPSKLHVPPWQMVSATLDGVSLRAATWWSSSRIYTTTPSSRITCWDASLGDVEDIGAVEIAKTGQWDRKVLGL